MIGLRVRRVVGAAAACLCVAAAGLVVFGALGFVATSGSSMQPTYDEGDLVIVAAANSYAVGQIVAYRDHVHDLVVLHRIVGGDATGYVLKGDSNAANDVVRPPMADLIGRAVFHVPRAGTWLRHLTHPAVLIGAALGLFAVAGTAGTKLRRRRQTMSRHAARRGAPMGSLGSVSPGIRVAAGVTAAAALLGLVLGALSWNTSIQTMGETTPGETRSLSFSYDTVVPRTAAYDGTRARSPDPVFRRLADTVDVHFTYQGGPGSVIVDAELSAANGWHSTIPLAARKTFTTDRYDGTARLDLSVLERRARAAAAATGLPIDRLDIAITPRVSSLDGTVFAPVMRLTLTPLLLALVNDYTSLIVQDTATTRTPIRVPRTLTVLKRQLPASTGRTIAMTLLLASALAAIGLVGVARRTAPADEGAAIRRRYAPLLLSVHPVPTPAGHPVADVTTFASLAKLAERYGLLILHWSRSNVDTFLVQTDGSTYRYRTGAQAPVALLVPGEALADQRI